MVPSPINDFIKVEKGEMPRPVADHAAESHADFHHGEPMRLPFMLVHELTNVIVPNAHQICRRAEFGA
jgi:hypothetical protein